GLTATGEPYTRAVTISRLRPVGSSIRQPGVSVRPLGCVSLTRLKLAAPAPEQYMPRSLRLTHTQPVPWSTTTPHRPPKPVFSLRSRSVNTGCQSGPLPARAGTGAVRDNSAAVSAPTGVRKTRVCVIGDSLGRSRSKGTLFLADAVQVLRPLEV